MWRNFVEYLRDVRHEMKKVTLPDRKSTWGSTFVVIVISIMLGLVIGLFDFVISKGLNLILR